MDVRLASVRLAAADINLFELAAPDRRPLAPVEPGSHLRLELPNGLTRAYFIAARTRCGTYLIGVRRDPDGRASKYLHDKVRLGARMRAVTAAGVELDATAKRAVIVAEDVGIFAAWPLLRAFDERGLEWELHYDAWSRDDAALLDELRAFGSRVTLHVRSERRGAALAWEPIVAACDASTRIYAVVSASSHEALARAFTSDGRALASRVRWASTTEVRSRAPVEFEVVLARSKRTLPVRQDESILEALRAEGIDVRHFCSSGICGTCRTRVLEGIPRHLDAVLTAPERAANDVMMICRSRATGKRLVLDL
jgi:vanillate O-demethylase ferredoxin subunit